MEPAFSEVSSEETRGNGHKLKLKKKLFCSEGSQTLEEVAQTSLGVSIFGDTQNWTEYPALADTASSSETDSQWMSPPTSAIL